MYACNGILFNHESPRRGETFITRKITRGLARIDAGLEKILFLGNLNSKRDWGHARDYVEMQWLMLQQDEPKDYVISTGRAESIRKFAEISAFYLGWSDKGKPGIIWEGEGLNEIGRRADTNEIVVKVDERYFRPTEVEELLGDPKKAFKKLGWVPKTSLEELIDEIEVVITPGSRLVGRKQNYFTKLAYEELFLLGMWRKGAKFRTRLSKQIFKDAKSGEISETLL